jgi:hypothetical protein
MTRKGFTLTEMLVALAVGMFILNIAFASFFFTQKFIRKTEFIGAKNDCTQSLMLWMLTGRSAANFPKDPQYRGVIGRIDPTPGAVSEFSDLIAYTEHALKSLSVSGSDRTIYTIGNHGLTVGMQVELLDTTNNKTALANVTQLKGSEGFICTEIASTRESGHNESLIGRVRPIHARLCIPKQGN